MQERHVSFPTICALALSTIAHSEYHYKKIQDKDISDKVDVKAFLKLW